MTPPSREATEVGRASYGPRRAPCLRREAVALLAGESVPAATPADPDLSDLIGEVQTQSHEYRTRWAAHNLGFHTAGIKPFHLPFSAAPGMPSSGARVKVTQARTTLAIHDEAESTRLLV